jgi:hypothetical protein
MDPLITSGLLKIGGSLLGGLFGKKSKGALVENHNAALGATTGKVAGAMMAAKAHHINPLTVLGVSSAGSVMPPGENYMGSAIADAALYAAEGLEKKAAEKGRISDLEKQNQDLRDKLTQETIRPKVGGIFAQREVTPTTKEALGLTGLGEIPLPNQTIDRGTGGFVGGLRWEGAPGWSPASVAEEEYGDVGSWIYGGAKFAADAGHNIGRLIYNARVKAAARNDGALTGRDGFGNLFVKGWGVKPPPYTMRFDPNHRDGYYKAGTPR